jgi:hypothetical protein
VPHGRVAHGEHESGRDGRIGERVHGGSVP